MVNFKTLNGYSVKDAEARNRITYLENNAIEGYDASWILDSESRTAENFKDLYDVLIFNSTDHSSLDYKNKKIDIFIKVDGFGNINCETETISTITEGTSYDDSAYEIHLITSQKNVNDPSQVIYSISKATDGTISYSYVQTTSYKHTVMAGTVASNEATLLGKSLNYPEGYTQANTIVLGYMIKYSGANSWSTCAVTKDGEMTDYANNLIVRLTENNIILNNMYAYLNEVGYDYRIVIMKIPTS